MKNIHSVLALLTLGSFTSVVSAGIYSGPSDTTNAIDPAIASTDSRFTEWADAIDSTRTSFAPGGSTTIDQTGGVNSLGDLSAAQIAAGDSPGVLTATFPTGIRNGIGSDFAVFENAGEFFSSPFRFAEFAYVEVSSNGIQFAQFPSISMNLEGDLITDFGRSFAGVDTTNVFNLAGKQAGGFGTPFDLDDLLTETSVVDGIVDLDNIQFVRLIDIPGDGSFLDSLGNPILDPWQTSGGTGGFDFSLGPGQGVGVINAISIPEPSGLPVVGFLLVVGLQRRQNRFLSNTLAPFDSRWRST